ncbi:MAG: hypothetical protein BMS9Abin07_2220 [Acidimicrobiia bacterium]|nr:MAG: hypothetical protein BMS9Abin07_2220 [Acidimicrobiia bacterium]
MVPVCGCLSAEVDLFAALVIGAIGIDALRHVTHRRQLVLAVIPITLAFHQLTEVGVWWSLGGKIPETIGSVSIWLYLAVAFVVVPIVIPLGVRNVESDRRRRRWMIPFLAGGVVVAVILAAALVILPVRAAIGAYYIEYGVGNTDYPVLGALYLGAVAAPLMMSSHRPFVWMGVANLFLVGGLAYLQRNGVISLWCLAAALQSVVIAHYLRVESGDAWKLPDRLRSLFAPSRAG